MDCVTQWQVIASVQTISEAHRLSFIAQLRGQLPLEILGFHADNGNGYVNHRVARMRDMLQVEFTRNRPRHSNDNGLAETWLEELRALATVLSGVQAPEELNEARLALFRRVPAHTQAEIPLRGRGRWESDGHVDDALARTGAARGQHGALPTVPAFDHIPTACIKLEEPQKPGPDARAASTTDGRSAPPRHQASPDTDLVGQESRRLPGGAQTD